MMMRVLCTAVLVIGVAGSATAADQYELAPINYSKTAPNDAVALVLARQSAAQDDSAR